MTDETAPALTGIGAVFIDDIVLPTGQTFMEQLGGGVVHALMGAAIWDERPGIVALVGEDLPEAVHQRLARWLDTRGLRRLPLPQIRAWQVFEEDGTRRELYRVRETQPFIRGAQPEDLPPAYQQSRGFYLITDFDNAQTWCQKLSGCVLWEPLQQIMTSGVRDQLRGVLQSGRVDIVSPNLAEAQAVYGDLPPGMLIDALLADGARRVALRMGAQGSLVAEGETHERWWIKALPAAVVDQTGAGNTYCGGLLAGLVQGRNLREAAMMAAVSASFCVEQVGVLDPLRVPRPERDHRLQQLRG